jgi:hypothetical protein
MKIMEKISEQLTFGGNNFIKIGQQIPFVYSFEIRILYT